MSLVTEDEIVGWHHRLNGCESEQTLGDSEGQRSLTCYSLWVHSQTRLSDLTTTTLVLPYLASFNTNRSPILRVETS